MKEPFACLLLSLGMAAMAGCSDGSFAGEPVEPADDWAVCLSRTDTGGENVTVVLRCGETTSYGTLVPATETGGTATWLNDVKPEWVDNTVMEVITFCPAVSGTLPTSVDATKNVAYAVDYIAVTEKPTTFTLTHLMAQLEVHIKISDDEQHHYEPTDGVVGLHTTAEVNYPEKKLDAPTGEKTSISLGKFTKEGDDNTSEENWVNTAQIVVPQTLEKDIPCLSFVAGGTTYTFTPEKDITLTAGTKTKLYLGVAFEQAGYVILNGVSVSDWTDGGTIDVGEMEESE